MHSELITKLDDCTEVRQILLARPPAIVRGTLGLSILLLGAAFVWAALSSADLVAEGRGVVRAAEEATRLESPVGGTVRRVCFEEGVHVRAGQILFELEDELLRVNLAKVEVEITAADNETRHLDALRAAVEAEIASEQSHAEMDLEVSRASLERERRLEEERQRDARSELALTEAAWTEALRSLKRARKLRADRILSEEELDRLNRVVEETKAKRARARARVEEEDSAVALARKKVLATEWARDLVEKRGHSRLRELEARVVSARSRRDQLARDRERLQLEINRRVVRAPTDGVVTTGELQPGDVVREGDLVAVIAPPGEVRFDAWVPNSEIAGLYVGQRARVKLDAYPYQQFGSLPGEISFIAPDATRGEGEKTNGASFYKVEIRLPRKTVGPDHPVELGMSGQVEMIRGERSILALAFQKLQDKVRL